MAISDTSPERRNLTILSLGFIIFYLAGGKVTDETVRIMVINLSFDKPHILANFAWVILLWFCLRFWQKHGFSLWASLKEEIISDGTPVSVRQYAIPIARSQLVGAHEADHSTKRITANNFVFESNSLCVLCNFMNDGGANTHQETVKLSGVKGWFYTAREIFVHSVKGNAVSEHLIPYLLFTFAISAPLWSKFI